MLTSFQGRKCNARKTIHSESFHILLISAKNNSVLSFFGNEWLGYDVVANSSAVIRSRSENISLSFKTVHPNAVLFIAGDQSVSSSDV
ncbi:hypothetical protein L596_027742 [Steinernema carpocapsae]|uniref:Uncharacterized protein n=1 Tax=Steinernema carpocapsae TaxID=34508 RepID=A0A4U5LWF0_STECR|nr:hypothetical protein L596_027742 [Steinernema carpocapsae]